MPIDEYYLDSFYGDGDYSEGFNFYTFGNTAEEYAAYRALYSSWEALDDYVDEYGDTWYCYADGELVVEFCYYYYEEAWVFDLYAYLIGTDEPDTPTDPDTPDTPDGDTLSYVMSEVFGSQTIFTTTDVTTPDGVITYHLVENMCASNADGTYRVYANQSAVISSTLPLGGVSFLGGGKEGGAVTVTVEVSTDGSSWQLVDSIDISGDPALYTFTFDKCAYTYVRISDVGKQLRITEMYFYIDTLPEIPDTPTTPDGEYLYTDFTAEEKEILNTYLGSLIPFIPNNEYGVEGYYDVDDYENGINFYTVGSTAADFDAYRALYLSAGYELYETYEDDYGDTWYCYVKDDLVVDLSYYLYENEWWIDVYAYSEIYSSDDPDAGDGATVPENLITNEGAGLPDGTDGVYDVDFTLGEYVTDVTDHGNFIDGCPTVGSPAVLVVPVEFSDFTAASRGFSIDKIKAAFTKDGVTDYYSVYDYYYISSYGKLTIDVTVFDEWFRPEHDSEYYLNATDNYFGFEVEIGDQLILDEVLAYLDPMMDLSDFDSDGNGVIDAVVMINTLDIDPDTDLNWAFRYWNFYTDENDEYYEYDGVSANDYLWASYYFMQESYDEEGNISYDSTDILNTYTYIHEFGHVIGARDYYDTSYTMEEGPMSGCDIMDYMLGDHNPFTKFNYGWLTESRLVTTEDSVTLTLSSFTDTGDTIILANNWDETLGAYQEYFIVAYYKGTGLNDESVGGGYFARDGVVVYHVNASLVDWDNNGETYYDIYANNTPPTDDSGTVYNLIEYVKSAADTFTYIEGDTTPVITLDSGEELAFTFVVDSLTDDTATLTFTRR
jgi:M6 family metalloprotease-like protein